MPENSYEALADLLDIEAAKVKDVEKRAYSALYDNKDEDSYRNLMRDKAIILSLLSGDIVNKIGPMDADEKSSIEIAIDRFSLSASQSLEIGSVFFMSALLYPDDYKEGDKNDLELFADNIRQKG